MLVLSFDVYNITLIQEQQDVEHNLKIIDQPSSKAMSCTFIRLIALAIISAAALLIFIITGWVFYYHPNQNHLRLSRKTSIRANCCHRIKQVFTFRVIFTPQITLL